MNAVGLFNTAIFVTFTTGAVITLFVVGYCARVVTAVFIRLFFPGVDAQGWYVRFQHASRMAWPEVHQSLLCGFHTVVCDANNYHRGEYRDAYSHNKHADRLTGRHTLQHTLTHTQQVNQGQQKMHTV